MAGAPCDDLASDLDDPLGVFDGAFRCRLRDIFGLVFGAVLERQQASERPHRVRALAPGLAEEPNHLTVIAAGSALARPRAADRIAGTDSCVDREARRRERVARLEAVACSSEEFLGFAQVDARLCCGDPAGPSWSRHASHSRSRRVVDPATWCPRARSPATGSDVTPAALEPRLRRLRCGSACSQTRAGHGPPSERS